PPGWLPLRFALVDHEDDPGTGPQPFVLRTARPQPLRPRALHEAEVARVVHDALRVPVFEVDPDRPNQIPHATLPALKRVEARNSSFEETAGLRPRLQGTQAEMAIGGFRRDPPPRGALQEACLNQIRLDDILDRAPLLADRNGETLNADRPEIGRAHV